MSKNKCVKLDIGDSCFEGNECDSGYCHNGECKIPLYSRCEKDKQCMYGRCKNNTCVPKKSGSKCSVKEDCESKLCMNGKCLISKKRIGSKCKHKRDCSSGKCIGGRCEK